MWHSQQDRLAGCHTAAWRHHSEKARDRSVCVCRVWGGCHVLFWCKAVLYSNDLSGMQTQKNGSNKEPLSRKQREKMATSILPILEL